jgi:FixJ family two-component response regulator
VDGLEVLQRLKDRGSRWPIIMMSGHGEASLAVDSLHGGAIDFLEKPFEEELLDRALDASARALAKDTRPAV